MPFNVCPWQWQRHSIPNLIFPSSSAPVANSGHLLEANITGTKSAIMLDGSGNKMFSNIEKIQNFLRDTLADSGVI